MPPTQCTHLVALLTPRPRWYGALLLGPQGHCPAGPHALPHPGLWLCAVRLSAPLPGLSSPHPPPPWPPPLSHRPALPPSGSRSSPSLAPGWPRASQRVLCLAPQPGGPRTHYESAWVGGGGHVEVLPLTPPQLVAHRPSLGETCRWMLLSSMTVSGPPSGTSTGLRSGEGREGMWSPPLGASQRHCLQLWHGATLASWAAPPPLQKPPRPQLAAPPCLSLGSLEGVETQGRPWAMVGAWPPALGVGVDPESSARPLRTSGR